MPQKAVDAYTDQLREKMASGDEPLTEPETKFLGDLTDSGYEGLNNDDPITQWQTDRAKNEKRIRDATGMSSTDAASRVAAIETKMDGTEPVSPEEQALVDAYHKAKSVTNRFGGRNGDSALRARAQREVAQMRADLRNRRAARVEVDGDDAVLIGVLVNTGWTDQARVAALAVRQAKSGARTQTPVSSQDGRVSWQLPVSSIPAGCVPAAGPGGSQMTPYVPPAQTVVKPAVQPVLRPAVQPVRTVQPVQPIKATPPVKGSPPAKGTAPGKGAPSPGNPPYQFYRKPFQGPGAKTRAV